MSLVLLNFNELPTTVNLTRFMLRQRSVYSLHHDQGGNSRWSPATRHGKGESIRYFWFWYEDIITLPLIIDLVNKSWTPRQWHYYDWTITALIVWYWGIIFGPRTQTFYLVLLILEQWDIEYRAYWIQSSIEHRARFVRQLVWKYLGR